MTQAKDLPNKNKQEPLTKKEKPQSHIQAKKVESLSDDFLTNFYKNTDGSLKKSLDFLDKASLAAFIKGLEEAKQKGKIRENIEPKLVLYMLDKLNVYLTDNNLLALYPTPQDAYKALINFFFKGIGAK